MKSNLTDYKEFCDTVKSGNLVYLFGTGISAALTGERYGWYKWILDGIHMLHDSYKAEFLEQELAADSSVECMISVVGKLLREAKEEGIYSHWMQESFEKNPVRNQLLAKTLQKLLVTQDVIATTNYDMLLEQATGLGALSYADKEAAFLMLDRKISDSVLHIHGIYDSAKGVDNIVADQEQYDAVLNDKGAQFIQQILGTRTLIFVGCGKTTDDVNIAQFIRFAKDWLKMDRQYYFLCNTKDCYDDMPDNIKLIPYGSEYEDLPEFLEDMVQMRLREKLISNPVVDRTTYEPKSSDTYGLSEYHFSNEILKFCGRSMELARLKSFAETDTLFSWWAITGQGGSGKSRLAYEFLKQLGGKYCSFFLNSFANESDIDHFIPFNHTLVVVDYIRGNEVHIAALVTHLMDLFKKTGYKLRILFLERDNQLLIGSWYQNMESAIDPGHRRYFLDAEYNTVTASRTHRFLYLDDLADYEVLELIGAICERNHLPIDKQRDETLKNEYSAKFEQLKFRPLFLQLYVETWIANGCIGVDYQNYRDLLETVLKKEQEKLLKTLNGDYSACSSLIRLLVRANITDSLSVEHIPEQYSDDWKKLQQYNIQNSLPGIQRKEKLKSLVGDASQALEPFEQVLKPLFPDIIKEYMFLNYVDESELMAFGEELWENNPDDFMRFLGRTLIDFPDDDVIRSYIRCITEDYQNLYALHARLSVLQNEVVHSGDDAAKLIQIVHEEYQFWNEMPVSEESTEEYRLLKLKGLHSSVIKLLGWNDTTGLDVLEKIACYPDSLGTRNYKIECLLEQLHDFVERAPSMVNAERLIELLTSLINQLDDTKDKALYRLRMQREKMMVFLKNNRYEKAKELYENIFDGLDMSNEQQMELYAYMCFSCVKYLFEGFQYQEMLFYAYEMQDMAEAYATEEQEIAFNDKIHYYYLYTKACKVESVSLSTTIFNLGNIGLQEVDNLIDEIRRNEMIADFASLLVWMFTLKSGTDDTVTDAEANSYLNEAEQLMKFYYDNAELATRVIELVDTINVVQLKRKVSRAEVEKCYVLVMRFHDKIEVIRAFHELLRDSVEAGKNPAYFENKQLMPTLIQNGCLDFIMPDYPEPETYVRTHKKIGANDPCPCGSGKKYKKCCRGKGIYE